MLQCPLVKLVVMSVAFVITVVSPRPPRTQPWDDQELGIRCRSGGQGERERWSVLQDREATQRGGGEHEATVTSKPQQRERKTGGKEERDVGEESVYY